MPKWFENGLVSMLSGVSIDGQVMNLGPLPAGQQPYLDWAQVYWLLGSKQSIPTLSALAGNLEKGMEEQIALRNSYRLTPVQLQAEARKVMAAGSFPALEVGGLANNPRQDFRDWYVPLGYSNLATLSARALQPGQRGLAEAIAATRPEYEALDVRAVAEIQALDALVALREGEREDARTVLATLTDLANTQSAWVYLEAAKMARSAAEKRRLAGYAADKNTEWSAVYRFLATLEEDAAQRGKVLLKAAERAPRDYALWEETAQALVDGREYALADRALEAASQAAPDDAERQRLRDARWELREDRARKDEEERQKQLSAERASDGRPEGQDDGAHRRGTGDRQQSERITSGYRRRGGSVRRPG
jgi:hypothetical protein